MDSKPFSPTFLDRKIVAMWWDSGLFKKGQFRLQLLRGIGYSKWPLKVATPFGRRNASIQTINFVRGVFFSIHQPGCNIWNPWICMFDAWKKDDTHIPQPVVFMVIYHGRISKKPPQTNPSEIRRISLTKPKVSSKTAKRRKLHPKPMAHTVDSSEIRNNHLQSGPKNIPKPVASTVK